MTKIWHHIRNFPGDQSSFITVHPNKITFGHNDIILVSFSSKVATKFVRSNTISLVQRVAKSHILYREIAKSHTNLMGSHAFLSHKYIIMNSSEINTYKKHTLQYECRTQLTPSKKSRVAREPQVGHPCTSRYILHIGNKGKISPDRKVNHEINIKIVTYL